MFSLLFQTFIGKLYNNGDNCQKYIVKNKLIRIGLTSRRQRPDGGVERNVGINLKSLEHDPNCEICMERQIVKNSFLKQSMEEVDVSEIIHSNVCGLMRWELLEKSYSHALILLFLLISEEHDNYIQKSMKITCHKP